MEKLNEAIEMLKNRQETTRKGYDQKNPEALPKRDSYAYLVIEAEVLGEAIALISMLKDRD